MATTTHPKFKHEIGPMAGYDVSVQRTFTDPVFATDGDIVQCYALKRGVLIKDFAVRLTDWDGGANLSWRAQVTDGSTTHILIAAQTTVGQSAGFVRAGGTIAAEPGLWFITTSNNWRIELEVLVTAGTPVTSGTIQTCLTVGGHRDSGDITE